MPRKTIKVDVSGPNPALRALHWLGQEAADALDPDAKTYGNRTLQQFCEKLAKDLRAGRLVDRRGQPLPLPTISKTTAYIARRFAMKYDSQQLETLCTLGERTGSPLGPSHVVELLRVENQRQRGSVASRCAAEGWSVRRLREKIAITQPAKRPRGRNRPRRATDKNSAIYNLKQWTDHWLNCSAKVFATEEGEKGCRKGDLPKALAKALDEATDTMRKLETRLSARLEQIRQQAAAGASKSKPRRKAARPKKI